jgi:hypothetical protein
VKVNDSTQLHACDCLRAMLAEHRHARGMLVVLAPAEQPTPAVLTSMIGTTVTASWSASSKVNMGGLADG